jgi:peptide deformylase
VTLLVTFDIWGTMNIIPIANAVYEGGCVTVRDIVLADDPLLRKKSKKVKRFGEALQVLIDDMVETMRAANGIGLAAPQVGVLERVIVIQMPEDEENPQSGKLFALCNPQIARAKGEEESEEGCLCLPGFVGEVKRATSVTVKAQDRRGKRVRIKAEGLLARAFQHEVDHLDGILFIDRVESPDKIRRIVPPEEEEEEAAETKSAL